MDQSLNLRGKRRPKSDLSVKATFCQRVKSDEIGPKRFDFSDPLYI